MDYKKQFFSAIDEGKIIPFLRGEPPYGIEPSQYVPCEEPTDVGRVLSDVVYECYKDRLSIKDIFEKALLEMLDGTATDVYLVTLYVYNIIFDEKHNLSPFTLDLGKIVAKLRNSIKEKGPELSKDIIFSNELIKKGAWNDIERWNKILQIKYNLPIII